MRNYTKTISTIVIILVGLFYYQNSFADTHNAASCSSADVTAAITAAASGDIVTIPSGDCSGTPWTTGVTIPSGKNITIQGAGYTNTIIAHSGCDAFNLNGTASRLTGIQIKHIPDTTGYGVVAFKTGWRIDHCFLNRNDDRDGGDTLIYEYKAITDGGIRPYVITGLIDNNIIHGRIDFGGPFPSIAVTEWTKPSNIGTENAVYIEDNVFNRIDCNHANVIDTNGGMSYVARYNTVTGHAQFMAHGTQSFSLGTRNWEIYGNNFVADKAVWMMPLAVMGGSGIVAFNTSNSNYQYGTTRHIYPYVMSGCTGDYPCDGQVGRGQNQILDPAYWFANFVGTSRWTRYGTVSHIQEGRDYYIQGSSFDGTSGVGCGTLANRPATCTTGVAYWATNQSCTNLAGMVGVNPATPISGTLYKCTAKNTWTAYYKPYTYPHPLRSGDVPKSTLIVSSTNGTVTSNPSGINCGSTCNADFNSDTSVTLNATTNSGYIFSGWSGACSGTGTCTVDMAEARFVQANFAQSALYKLTVTKLNSSAGTVTSSDRLINCGSTCSANYAVGKSVTLIALPINTKWAKYRFAGWSGACSGTGTCTVNMTAAKSVKATFYYDGKP